MQSVVSKPVPKEARKRNVESIKGTGQAGREKAHQEMIGELKTQRNMVERNPNRPAVPIIKQIEFTN